MKPQAIVITFEHRCPSKYGVDDLVRFFRLMKSTQYLAERLGSYMQVYTLYSSVRPFGISSIVGGVDDDGPSLYVIEPSGVFYVGRFSVLSVTISRSLVRVTMVPQWVKVVNSQRLSSRS